MEGDLGKKNNEKYASYRKGKLLQSHIEMVFNTVKIGYNE